MQWTIPKRLQKFPKTSSKLLNLITISKTNGCVFTVNPLRTTSRLVKTYEVLMFKPIRDIVRMVELFLQSESKYLEN